MKHEDLRHWLVEDAKVSHIQAAADYLDGWGPLADAFEEAARQGVIRNLRDVAQTLRRQVSEEIAKLEV